MTSSIVKKGKLGAFVAVLCAALLSVTLASPAFAADTDRTPMKLGDNTVTVAANASSAEYQFTAPTEGWYSFLYSMPSNSSWLDVYVSAAEQLGGTFGNTRYSYENGTHTDYIKLAAGQVANFTASRDSEDVSEALAFNVVVAKAVVSKDINSAFYESYMTPVYLNGTTLVAQPQVTITDANGDYLIEGRDFTVSADFYVDNATNNGYNVATKLELPVQKTDEDGYTYWTGGNYYLKVTGTGTYKGDRYIAFTTQNYRNIYDLDKTRSYYGVVSNGSLQNAPLVSTSANLGGKNTLVPNALTVVGYDDDKSVEVDGKWQDGTAVTNGKFEVGKEYGYTYKAAAGFVDVDYGYYYDETENANGTHRTTFRTVDAAGSEGTAYGKPMELNVEVDKTVRVQPNKPVYVKFTAPADGYYFIGDIREGYDNSNLYADPTLKTPVLDYNLTKGQTVYAMFNYASLKYNDPKGMTLSVLPDTELVVAEKVTATGKAVEPAVTVKWIGETLEAGKDYTVTYTNNVKPGTATVTVEGIGEWKNSLKLAKDFEVVAAKGKVYAAGALNYKVTNANTEGKGAVSVKNAVKGKKKTKTVTIPKTVKIGNVKYTVTAIEDKAFKGYTKMTKVSIGANVKTIGKSAFSGDKKLKTVSGGKGLVTIKDSAFEKCTKLTKITLNKKVKTIGKKVFYKDKKLKKITVKANKMKVGKDAIKGIYAKATIDVPNSKVKAYQKVFKKSTGFKSTMKLK